MMKLACTVAILLLCSGAAFGQADAKPQSQCRPLQSGDFISSNESIVGSGSNMMVCPHPAKVAAIEPVAVSTPYTAPTPAAAGVGPRVGPRVAPGATPRVQFAAGYQYDSV